MVVGICGSAAADVAGPVYSPEASGGKTPVERPSAWEVRGTDLTALYGHIRDVTWSTWGEETALGAGSIETDARGDRTQRVGVAFAKPVSCAGNLLYSELRISPEAGESLPAELLPFTFVKRPCIIRAGPYARLSNSHALSTRQDREERGGSCPVRLFSRASGGYPLFCRMTWTGWNTPTARGVGVMRTGPAQYGAEVVFSRPALCGGRVSYTRMRYTRRGSRETVTVQLGTLTEAHAKELRRNITRRAGPKVTRTERLEGCSAPAPGFR